MERKGKIALLFISCLVIVAAVRNRRKYEYNFSFAKKTFTDLEAPGFKIVDRITRDYKYCYEQGILFKDSNTLIESCGLYGKSNIQEYSLVENKALRLKPLDHSFFGEGTDLYANPETGKDEIYQLTWRERKVFVWDESTLQKVREYTMPREMQEGWGLTHRFVGKAKDEFEFVASDGTNKIFLIEPKNFSVKKILEINNEDGTPQWSLNELQMIKGRLFANVYLTKEIDVLDIDKEEPDRRILKKLNFDKVVEDFFTAIPYEKQDMGECLNGIAYDEKTDTTIITGKHWPFLYKVKFSDSLFDKDLGKNTKRKHK